MGIITSLLFSTLKHLFHFIISFNPLYVTICPEPFGNFGADSVTDMLEILPMKFPPSVLDRKD
jgi:hypothetical protein